MMAPSTTRTGRESSYRLSDCVTALLRDQPFFGSLALRLPIRADASRETLASDGHEIRYSPEWVADTDADLIKTAIGRVVLACTLKHHTRRGERDPDRWQRASQLVTHGLLRDAGFTLPTDAEAWEGLSVEQAYDRLPEPENEQTGPTAQLPGPAATPQARNPLPVTTIPAAAAIRPTTAIRKRKAIQPRTAAALNPVIPVTRPITAIRNGQRDRRTAELRSRRHRRNHGRGIAQRR